MVRYLDYKEDFFSSNGVEFYVLRCLERWEYRKWGCWEYVIFDLRLKFNLFIMEYRCSNAWEFVRYKVGVMLYLFIFV